MSDDDLFALMFHPDWKIAAAAKKTWDKIHAEELSRPVPEPAHCPYCFEGCDRCQS